MSKESIFRIFADCWPSPIVARDQVHLFTDGLYKPKHLANLDCLGQGPEGRIRIGKRKIAYPVESFVRWLEERAEEVEK
jgi:hypothetical protein